MGWVRSNLSEVKRLKARLGGGRRVVELADGSRFYFEPEKVFEVMFMFFMNSLRAIYEGIERPEAPEIVRAIAGAVDRERAFRTVFPQGSVSMPLNEEALVERGEIVPRRLMAGENLEGGEVLEDLSE